MGTGSQSRDANITKFDDRSRVVVLQADVTRGQTVGLVIDRLLATLHRHPAAQIAFVENELGLLLVAGAAATGAQANEQKQRKGEFCHGQCC